MLETIIYLFNMTDLSSVRPERTDIIHWIYEVWSGVNITNFATRFLFHFSQPSYIRVHPSDLRLVCMLYTVAYNLYISKIIELITHYLLQGDQEFGHLIIAVLAIRRYVF